MEEDSSAADPFAAESLRVAGLLAKIVREQRVSVRSLEKKMEVAESLFSKVLKGKITLHFRHVLMICTALGIDWKDFFAHAYGLAGGPLTETERFEQIAARLLVALDLAPEERVQEVLRSWSQQPVGITAQVGSVLEPDQKAADSLDEDLGDRGRQVEQGD